VEDDRPKIEITDEMIEAGSEALMGLDPDYDGRAFVVRRVFCAMLSKMPADAWDRLRAHVGESQQCR